MDHAIDFTRLEREIETLSDSYRSAEPFEHVVIDAFLKPEAIELLRKEDLVFRPSTNEKSSDFVFAKNKIENPSLESISDITGQLRDDLVSQRFAKILSEMVGMEVFVDKNFVGGGLHQGGRGSFLDMHADFTRHPAHNSWIRELNILIYLNREYDPDWGGSLDLEHADSGSTASIAPIENRAVIMLTKPHTLHGYRKINFPPNRLRTSIAAYAYSLDDGSRVVPYLSTAWRPRNRIKRAFAKAIGPIVAAKQRIFGSRTANRAKRPQGQENADAD